MRQNGAKARQEYDLFWIQLEMLDHHHHHVISAAPL